MTIHYEIGDRDTTPDELFGSHPPVTSERSRWVALVVLCVGMLMIVLDVTVVNVALPSIQRDLRFSQANLAWVVNAYLLTFGGLLLLAGRIGDLFSRRSVFLSGLAIFTSASLFCGLAQTQAMLIGARFLQGVGGAMTSAVILGMIVTMFPEPHDQAKAIGVFSFVGTAGGSIGLLAGGLVTQALDWHWIFFINLPVGAATAVLARRLLPGDRGTGLQGGVDVTGALLITSGLMLAVYAIVKPAAEYGWTSIQTLAFIGAALAVLTAFVAREATARNPLIPLGIFRSRTLTGTNAIQILTVPAMFGMFFLGSLYLQRVLGYDALHIGLAFLPLTVLAGTLSLGVTDRLTMRVGAKHTLICGFVFLAAGLAVLTQLSVRGAYLTDIFPAVLLFGIGAGLAFPALMTLAMSSATPDDAGLSSGLISTTQQIGGALGLAVLATVASSRTHQLAFRGQSSDTALTQGYRLAFLIALGLIAVAIVMAEIVLRRSPKMEEAGLDPEGAPLASRPPNVTNDHLGPVGMSIPLLTAAAVDEGTETWADPDAPRIRTASKDQKDKNMSTAASTTTSHVSDDEHLADTLARDRLILGFGVWIRLVKAGAAQQLFEDADNSALHLRLKDEKRQEDGFLILTCPADLSA